MPLSVNPTIAIKLRQCAAECNTRREANMKWNRARTNEESLTTVDPDEQDCSFGSIKDSQDLMPPMIAELDVGRRLPRQAERKRTVVHNG